MEKLIISADDSNQTVIKFLKKILKTTSLSLIYKLLRSKAILLNNKKITDYSTILEVNDEILIKDLKIKISKNENILETSNIVLNIIYEDENLLIIDKPHNVIVHHPTQDCLDLAVRNYLKPLLVNNSYSFTISHVHRLDKLTRGLICYAKNKIASKILLHAIQEHKQIEKTYLAVCDTVFEKKSLIEGYIIHDEKLKKMVFSCEKNSPLSKFVAIKIEPILIKNNQTLLQIKLLTGRKHQIRAILSYFNSPIIGDFKYGSQKRYENKIFLFAYQLKFRNLVAPLNYLNNKFFFISNLKNDLENNLGNY